MNYPIKHSSRLIPDMSWQVSKDNSGWWQATVYSGSTAVDAYGPLPTPAMVLSIMRKNGYEPLDDDMPEGWQVLPRHELSTKEVTALFSLKGNRVASACKKGSLKASLDDDGKYLIHEEDAAEWYLRSLNNGKKLKKNGKLCDLCATQMIKDGVGKAPLICPACHWPRRHRSPHT